MLLYGVFFYAAILIAKRHDTLNQEVLQLNHTLTLVAALVLVLVVAAYTVQIMHYNHLHPKTPIRYLGLLPPELKEEDEGMRMFTARATRRVYIFHATFLPIFAILYAYLLPPPVYVVSGLAFLVLGHFGIYLATIWPVLGEDKR